MLDSAFQSSLIIFLLSLATAQAQVVDGPSALRNRCLRYGHLSSAIPVASQVAAVGTQAIFQPNQPLTPTQMRSARLHQALALGIAPECLEILVQDALQSDARQFRFYTQGIFGGPGAGADTARFPNLRVWTALGMLTKIQAYVFPTGCVGPEAIGYGLVDLQGRSPVEVALERNAGSELPPVSSTFPPTSVSGNRPVLTAAEASQIRRSFEACDLSRTPVSAQRSVAYLVNHTPEELRRALAAYAGHGDALNLQWSNSYSGRPDPNFNASAYERSQIDYHLNTDLSFERVRMFQHFITFVHSAHTEGEIRVMARALAQGASELEQVQYASWLGDLLVSHYDQSRRGVAWDGSGRAGGSVTFAQLLENYRSSYLTGITSDLGVCRDIARAQAQFLTYMGFTETFIISSGSRRDLMHVTPIARSNVEPNTVYHFNYGLTQRHDLSGSRDPSTALLTPGGGDFTHLGYRIFDSDGNPVGSEQGPQAVALATMAGIELNDPLSAPAPFVTSYATPPQGRHQMRWGASAAEDSLGFQYLGVSVSMTAGNPDSTPRHFGAMLALQHRPDDTDSIGRGNAASVVATTPARIEDIDAAVLFAYFQQNWNSPALQLFKGQVSARMEAFARVIFSMFTTLESDPHPGGAMDLRGQGQLHVRQGDWASRFASEFIVGAQVEPSIGNVTNTQLGQIPVPVLTHLLFSGEGRLRLSRSISGRSFLVAAVLVLTDMLGSRGRAQLGLVFNNVAITGQIQGAMTSGVQPWQSGSQSRAGLGLHFTIPDAGIRLGMNMDTPLDGFEPTFTGNAVIELDGRPGFRLPRTFLPEEGPAPLWNGRPERVPLTPHPREVR